MDVCFYKLGIIFFCTHLVSEFYSFGFYFCGEFAFYKYLLKNQIYMANYFRAFYLRSLAIYSGLWRIIYVSCINKKPLFDFFKKRLVHVYFNNLRAIIDLTLKVFSDISSSSSSVSFTSFSTQIMANFLFRFSSSSKLISISSL